MAPNPFLVVSAAKGPFHACYLLQQAERVAELRREQRSAVERNRP